MASLIDNDNKENRRGIGAILVSVGLVFFTSTALAFFYYRFMPVSELGGFKLGMSDTDVTLALGKEPKYSYSYANGMRKGIVYYGVPWIDGLFNDIYYGPTTTLLFQRSGRSFVLFRACSTVWMGAPKGIESESTEEEILLKLGSPTSVSISESGTKKISSFARSNLAFEFFRGKIEMSCISDKFPITYENQQG